MKKNIFDLFVTKILVFILVIFFVLFLSKNANADVMNPEYLTKRCKSGETEVIAKYKSDTPFGPKTLDETKKYENNPDYYFLVGHGSSFGGSSKYCLKKGARGIMHNEIFDTILVALISGVSFIGLRVLRKRNVH